MLHGSTAGVPSLDFLFMKRGNKLLDVELKDTCFADETVPIERTRAG